MPTSADNPSRNNASAAFPATAKFGTNADVASLATIGTVTANALATSHASVFAVKNASNNAHRYGRIHANATAAEHAIETATTAATGSHAVNASNPRA